MSEPAEVFEEIVTEIEKTDEEAALKTNKVAQLEKDYIIKIRALKAENSKLRIERDRLYIKLYQISKIIKELETILSLLRI